MLRTCIQILDYPNVDHYLRVGDVFAEIIEYYYTSQNYQQAYAYINKMRERRIIISPYLDQEIVDTVYQRLGIETDSQIEEEVDEF
jgi:intraflagellar transport protein 140